MKLKIGDIEYPCSSYNQSAAKTQLTLSDGKPEELGERLILSSDDGFILAEISVMDYLRFYWCGNDLILIKTSEPNQFSEQHDETESLNTEAIMAMLVDQEYRLTLLELGVN